MKANYDLALTYVLAHEGGYVDHPADPGGATNMGITRKTLAAWRHIVPWTALPKSHVRKLTRTEASAIYRAEYWSKVRGDDLPAGIDYAVFDFAVNSGRSRAVRYLQDVLDVRQDGIIGPVTIAAANAADAEEVIDRLCDMRMDFLRALATWGTFGRGWKRRVDDVRVHALAMVENNSALQTEEPPAAPSPPNAPPSAASLVWQAVAGIFRFIASFVKGLRP